MNATYPSREHFVVAVDREYIDLAENFLRNRRQQRQEWRAALADGNDEILRRVGDELKGTAAAFGFYSLSDLAAVLEEALESGDKGAAGSTLERMIELLDRAAVVPR